MGVSSLWSVLEPVGQTWSLSNDVGQTIAIDLSVWIVQGRKAVRSLQVSEAYVMMRTIFYRTINLLKMGLKLVFVIDGDAPAIKSAVMAKRQETSFGSPSSGSSLQRQWYKDIAKKCCRLFDALGIPYIQSTGEAEKTCAYLNKQKVVDACLTDDSDAFLYGAEVVYRNYRQDNKGTTVEKYTMSDIETRLFLDRHCLVSFALLSGCDYDGGVKGMGQKKTVDLIKDIKKNHKNVLDRILDWRKNSKIVAMDSMLDKLDKTQKKRHCSYCQHQGSQQIHKSKGCSICKTDSECLKSPEDPCSCTWHLMEAQVDPFSLELKVRRKALEDEDFPNQKIVQEFLDDEESLSNYNLDQKHPNLAELQKVLGEYLKFLGFEMMKKIAPLLVCLKLRRWSTEIPIEPLRIEKSCQENFLQCYQVAWGKSGEDTWTPEDHYTVVVEKELFCKQYSQMANEYEESVKEAKTAKSTSGKKRKLKGNKDPSQEFISDHFKKVKRKLDLGESNTSEKGHVSSTLMEVSDLDCVILDTENLSSCKTEGKVDKPSWKSLSVKKMSQKKTSSNTVKGLESVMASAGKSKKPTSSVSCLGVNDVKNGKGGDTPKQLSLNSFFK